MKYDFDTLLSRKNTGSVKWDLNVPLFGRDDVIPMWVADMDFPAAQPIVDALKERAAHPFYGYTEAGQSLRDAIVERFERKFGWQVRPDWIVFTPGVIPAINIAIRSLARPSDEIILQEPVYYPFFPSVKQSGCQIATNALKLENGQYYMDYEDLEKKFAPSSGMMERRARARALVLCNPHNPVGRLWTREEMTRAGEIVLAHGGTVISDEIHCELLYKDYTHTPFASISEEFARNSIVCFAPSKTFNLAGLGASSIIIPDEKLRNGFKDTMAGMVSGLNLFGIVAMEAAYRHGDEWLDQLKDYLQKNLDFTLDFIRTRIPRLTAIEPQGTYLLWLDCRALGLDDEELKKFMREEAKLGLDDGYMFGAGGSGFQRINIACPRSLLEEALQRLEKAVNGLV